MNESFISYLWKYRLLHHELMTSDGETLVVLNPGEQNPDGGPDFFNARIRIGDTLWAGNVEIHVRSSDWYRHGHQGDKAYANTILHVVFVDDQPVVSVGGGTISTLVIRGKFPETLYDRYLGILQNDRWIPCENLLKRSDNHLFSLWAPSLAVERLEAKSEYVRNLWESCLFDWDEAFYRHLSWCFGFRINNVAFELLACSLPLKMIMRHTGDLIKTEALLFGLAGMLDGTFSDEYPRKLQQEYRFLTSKHNLEPVAAPSWKFLRMRPSGFPTIRISQWAHLLSLTGGRFFSMTEEGKIPRILFRQEIAASEYWNTHYLFDKPSVFSRKSLGRGSANLLVINGIAPFIFFYGMEKDLPVYREKALDLLEQSDFELNAETAHWKSLGISHEHALHSQALIQLKRNYCDQKRCLECRIGKELLSEKDASENDEKVETEAQSDSQ